MIEEFKNILKAGGGTTMAQEGYGTAFNNTEADLEDTSSLAESILQYYDRETVTERTMEKLEGRLAALDLGSRMGEAPPQADYFMP